MKDLQTLLAGKASLIKIIGRYRAKILMAQKELHDINVALNILQKYGLDVSEDVQLAPKTVGDMALEVLKDHPEGLTANQILSIIRERWMPNLMRSSMSPPLSRLKHLDMVELNGYIWKLVERNSKINVAESERHYAQALDTQRNDHHSLQAIVHRQIENIAQLQDHSAIAKEVMDKKTPEEKNACSAELIRRSYEQTYEACRRELDNFDDLTAHEISLPAPANSANPQSFDEALNNLKASSQRLIDSLANSATSTSEHNVTFGLREYNSRFANNWLQTSDEKPAQDHNISFRRKRALR